MSRSQLRQMAAMAALVILVVLRAVLGAETNQHNRAFPVGNRDHGCLVCDVFFSYEPSALQHVPVDEACDPGDRMVLSPGIHRVSMIPHKKESDCGVGHAERRRMIVVNRHLQGRTR